MSVVEGKERLRLERLEDRILLSAGFGSAEIIENYASDVNPQSVRAADVDGDNDSDVVVGTQGARVENTHRDRVAWFENQDGQFGSEQVISTDVNGGETVRTADLDGDDDQDVLSASYLDDTIGWFQNQGGGSFSSQKIISTQVNEAGPMEVVRIDGDQYPDILAASPADGWVGWYRNDGDGNFGDKIAIASSTDMVKDLVATDIDSDGNTDVVACYGTGADSDHKLSWWENQGGGSFGSEQVIDGGFSGMQALSAVRVGSDGYPDLVVGVGDPGRKLVMYENEDGSGFGSQQLVSEGVGEPWSLYGKDLTKDGDADMICADYWHGISWFDQQGAGFGPEREVSSNVEWAVSVHAADVDQDTDMDILAAWEKGDKVAFYRSTLASPPDIDSLSASPNPVVKPGSVTLTASGVSDPDGSVEEVDFFLDDGDGTLDPAEDNLIETDGEGGDGWQISPSTQDWSPGAQTIFARAEDSDGKLSDPVSTEVTIQVGPSVESVTVEPDPVVRPHEVTVTVTADDADGDVQEVHFYGDTNDNGSFDPQLDTHIGTDADGSDGWSYSGETEGISLGTHIFFVRAVDSDNLKSDVVSGEIEVVENSPPVVESFTDSPDPVVRPRDLTLSVTASDSDGQVRAVEFYADTNESGSLEPGQDGLLTRDEDGSDGWSWTGATMGWPVGTHTYFARAQDNVGVWSETASTTGTIQNAPPTIDSLMIPEHAAMGSRLSLAASATDPDDPAGRPDAVRFYHDVDGDGTGESDELLNIDNNGDDGWTATVQVEGWELGSHQFIARAVDSDGATDTGQANTRVGYRTVASQVVESPNGDAVTVSYYDTDASNGTLPDDIIAWSWSDYQPGETAVVVDSGRGGDGAVDGIFLRRSDSNLSDLGMTVEGNTRLRRVIDQRGSADGLSFIASQGGVGATVLRSDISGADLEGFTAEGGWSLPDSIGGSAPEALYAEGSVRSVSVSGTVGGDLRAGSFNRVVARPGPGRSSGGLQGRIVAAGGRIGSVTAIGRGRSGGSIGDGVVAAGPIRSVRAIHGSVEGPVEARGNIRTINAIGGDVDGSLESTGGRIIRVTAKGIGRSGGSLGGNLTAAGDIITVAAVRGDGIDAQIQSENGSVRTVKAVHGDIAGSIRADGSVQTVVAVHGDIDADITSENGSARTVIAVRGNVNGNVTSETGSIRAVKSVHGGIGGAVRAAGSIRKVTAIGGDIAGPVESTGGRIQKVTAKASGGSGGAIRDDVTAAGGIGSLVAVRGSGISGDIDAGSGSLGTVKSVRGDISGSLRAGGPVRVVVAVHGDIAAPVTSGDGSIGTVKSVRGTISGDITAQGPVNAVVAVGGDVAAPVESTGGRIGRIVAKKMGPGGSISGGATAGGGIGSIVAVGGDIELQDRQISAGSTVGSLRAVRGSILGDGNDNRTEISVSGGNLRGLQAVRGDIDGVAVDVSGGGEDRTGNLNRVMATRSSTGIVDSLFEADGRLGLVQSTGRWDREAGKMVGGQLRMTDVSAGDLGRVSVQRLGTENGSEQCTLEDRSGGQWWLFTGRDRERVDGTRRYEDTQIEA